MYNHYIPQSDGSFRRNTVPESRSRPQPPPAPPPPPPLSPAPPQKPEPPGVPPPEKPRPSQPPGPPEACPPESPLRFLRGLLPEKLDLYDLIVIGVLLLLSGDEKGDDLSPMLTIALYFLL